jgi:hypothetical protein
VLSKSLQRNVTLKGITEIMFDAYPGDNKTKLTPDQKLYLMPDKTVYLPALNIRSFLTAQNTMSAPKMLLDSKEYKRVADALAATVSITPTKIPFLRDGVPIKFKEFVEQSDGTILDKSSGITVQYHVARLDKGIPNPKERPVLGLPWMLKFQLAVAPHPELSEDMIENLFTQGGLLLGLGTFRKVYGKFEFAW